MSFSGLFYHFNNKKEQSFRFYCRWCQRTEGYGVSFPTCGANLYCFKCRSNLLFLRDQQALYTLSKIKNDEQKIIDDCIIYLLSRGYFYIADNEETQKYYTELLEKTLPCMITSFYERSTLFKYESFMKNKIIFIRPVGAFNEESIKWESSKINNEILNQERLIQLACTPFNHYKNKLISYNKNEDTNFKKPLDATVKSNLINSDDTDSYYIKTIKIAE